MTVNWTQEPARSVQPAHPHNTLAWTLWILSIVAVVTWGVCMALGISLDGRVHLLLGAFAVLMIVHVILGFNNVEYFVPLRLTGRWFRGWRGNRDRPHVVTEILKDDPAPPLDSPRSTGTIIPGNDPTHGPGQRTL